MRRESHFDYRKPRRTRLATNCALGLAAAVVVWSAGAARATPVPTPTPGLIRINVQAVGPLGLVPAANISVDVCRCSDPVACFETCEPYPIVSDFTDAHGTLVHRPHDSLLSQVSVAFATIEGVTLRGLAAFPRGDVTVTIDPISEAAVEILSGSGYSFTQDLIILDAVRHANVGTNFAGLSLQGAIARARAVALDDSHVQAAVFTWTPTPTVTPTPTRTRRPTGTPRPCLGDCTGDRSVEVGELIMGVNILLGQAPGNTCASGYPEMLDVSDLIVAVYNALYGCESPLPDLVPESVRFASGPSCSPWDDLHPYLSYCLDVCIANVGDGSAPTFTLAYEDGALNLVGPVSGLAAGDGECDRHCGTSFAGSVQVDANDDVPESREDNNLMVFRIATPTPPPTCPRPSPT